MITEMFFTGPIVLLALCSRVWTGDQGQWTVRQAGQPVGGDAGALGQF